MCRCSAAVIGRLGNATCSAARNPLKKRLWNDCQKCWTCWPVLKSDGFSSVICYKCKWELHESSSSRPWRLQNEIQTVHTEQTESHSHIPVKRCQYVIPGASKKQSCSIPFPPATLSRSKEPKSWICPVPNHDDLIVATVTGFDKFIMANQKARVRFGLGNLKTASDWIRAFKEPNTCSQRISRSASLYRSFTPPRVRKPLGPAWYLMSVPNTNFKSTVNYIMV